MVDLENQLQVFIMTRPLDLADELAQLVNPLPQQGMQLPLPRLQLSLTDVTCWSDNGHYQCLDCDLPASLSPRYIVCTW